MATIATIINFCTIDAKFIGHCIRRVAPFSTRVLVPHGDHLFDGTPEDLSCIDRIAATHPEADFLRFRYHHDITQAVGAPFWHNFARWTGFQQLDDGIDYILFLDSDELVDTERFREFVYRSGYDQYDYLYLATHWYWREPRYRARQLEDSPLLVRRSVLKKNIIFHDHERSVVAALPNGVRMVEGMDGQPMVHHLSWVRTESEMHRKVSTWGHSGDVDLTAKVAEEFSRPFNGTDFVHGYAYDEVEPIIELTNEYDTAVQEDWPSTWSLSLEAVDQVDLSPLSGFVAHEPSRKFFLDTDFREHYRLLAHLGGQLQGGLIFDVGTYRGYSALALGYAPANRVVSYDLVDYRELGDEPLPGRIEFCIGDACNDVRLPKADLVLLDTSHDGIYEARFYQHLQQSGFKGLLVLDDIHLNPEMEAFWENISEPKWDATRLGHWSGTGLVDFSRQ